MGRAKLSSQEIQSLLRDVDDSPKREVASTRIWRDAVDRPAAEVDRWDRPQDRELPVSAESTEAASNSRVAETFAHHLSAALSQTLRAAVPVAVVRVEQMSFGEFVAQCKQPTLFAMVRENDGTDTIALEIRLPVLLAAINRLMGGSLQDDPLPVRPLTQIEKTLAERIVDLISGQLQVAFGGNPNATWHADSMTECPKCVQASPATQTVVCIDFAVQIGSTSGLHRFAVPGPLFERAKRAHCTEANRSDESSDANSRVELSALLARWSTSRCELLNLKVGDVIELDAGLKAAIEVEVDGQLQFYASPGALDGNRAIKIEQIAESD